MAYAATLTLANFAASNQTFVRVSAIEGTLVYRNSTQPALNEYLTVRMTRFLKSVNGVKVPYVRYNWLVERRNGAYDSTLPCKYSSTFEVPEKLAGLTTGTSTAQSDLLDAQKYLAIATTGSVPYAQGLDQLSVTP